MDAEERADVIRKAFDIIERPVEVYEGPANPTRAYWEELRAYQRPKLEPTQPRWPALDTARGQSARDAYVDRRADLRIANAFEMHEESLQSLAYKPGLLKDVFADVIAQERRRVRREFKAEVKELRCELAAEVATLQCQLDEAKAKIKELQFDAEALRET